MENSNEGAEFTVMLVGNDGLLTRWEDVAAALERAFADSDFLAETSQDPVKYTRAGVEGKLRPALVHAVAFDAAGRVIGGLFCIPSERDGDETDGDVGWIFTAPEVRPRARVKIMDALMGCAFVTMAKAGFTRIVTQMGTTAGARAISRRYGLVHTPMGEHKNRWVKEL